MTETRNLTLISESTLVMRTDAEVRVRVTKDGSVENISFDGHDSGAVFQCPQHISLLVLHLKTDGDGDQPARFATHPIQFKDRNGRPIPQPPSIRVQRDSDSRCTLHIVNTVVEEESFGFHAVFIYGESLFGSPDPTINLDPPPCSGPNCDPKPPT